MFDAIRWCHMEFAQPSVAKTMNGLEVEGEVTAAFLALVVVCSIQEFREL